MVWWFWSYRDLDYGFWASFLIFWVYLLRHWADNFLEIWCYLRELKALTKNTTEIKKKMFRRSNAKQPQPGATSKWKQADVRRQELCRGANCIFWPRLRSSAQKANILFHAFHYRLRLCTKSCQFKKRACANIECWKRRNKTRLSWKEGKWRYLTAAGRRCRVPTPK